MFGNCTTNYCHKQQNNCIKIYEKQVLKSTSRHDFSQLFINIKGVCMF